MVISLDAPRAVPPSISVTLSVTPEKSTSSHPTTPGVIVIFQVTFPVVLSYVPLFETDGASIST